MKAIIIIPDDLEKLVNAHLFQNQLEQGAFLFAVPEQGANALTLQVKDAHLVSLEGWRVQSEVYLEMQDAERARIMKKARDSALGVIDCHSHPGSLDKAWFSPSDQTGITEFAGYAKWKLDGLPYVAMVWGESSVDAVLWCGDFTEPHKIDEVHIVGGMTRVVFPRGTWFRKARAFWWRDKHGR